MAFSGSMPGPGSYAHSGSDAMTAPVAAKARERDPPHISRNPQRPHFPKSAFAFRKRVNTSSVR